ncbi:hypothetical protein [Bradyrhizobium tunisiense]|uniref:hypothetical protein n=1 Tax=Bradyrhizobium tunisiense TaxID=3278709 RepID=UPI0035DFA25D
METMTGASINMGMRAVLCEEPLELDRRQPIRERPCGAAINFSIAISPSIVVKKPHASGLSQALDDRSAPAHASLS